MHNTIRCSVCVLAAFLSTNTFAADSAMPYQEADFSDLAPAAGPASPASPTTPTPGAPEHITLGTLFQRPAAGAPALAPDSFEYAILNGHVWLDARYRHEQVSQNGIHRRAEASTLRSRFGYETGLFEGFKAGFEMENLRNIGAEHYNSGINGKALYPTVADPEDTNVHQAYLAYDGFPKTEIKTGRQLINLDNQRFVGMSDWRQHSQTFDAASIYSTYFDHATLFYAYVRQVNRVFGDNSSVGTFVGNSHLANASYEFAPALKITGYTYLLDFQSAKPSIKALSDATFGLRLTGKYPLCKDATLSYTAEGAHQTSNSDNPAGISENYYLIEPAISAYGFTGKVGYEMLEGNGTTAFQTPLATFHAFDGWADKFLTTPNNGLLDKYASLSYKVPFGDEWIKGTSLTGVYRKFNSDTGNVSDGHEWDGLVEHTFFGHYTTSFEVADYKADHLFTNTTKAMAFLTVKY
jgi:hypothetical protein